MRKTVTLFLFIFLLMTNLCFANANIDINADDDVPEYQVDAVVNSIKMTTQYMNNNYGRLLTKDITINIKSDDNAKDVLSHNDEINKVTGNAQEGKINLIFPSDATIYYVTFIASHELTHMYQLECFGGYEMMNKNLWFMEGMADLIGAHVAEQINPDMSDKFQRNAVNESISNPIMLKDITTKADWQNHFYKGEKTYAKADLALIYLSTRFPSSLMFAYLNNLYNYSASTALKNIYGISIDELDEILDLNKRIL